MPAQTSRSKKNYKQGTSVLYIASAILVFVVLCVTVLPNLVGGADYLYRTGTLTILYSAISLAVALITFGVIGDSGALIRFSREKGSLVQISGSAAGFAIFFYLLSSGLNPYQYLDIYIHDTEGRLLDQSDGTFEVKIASHISQTEETADGHASFPLPRSQNGVRLAIQPITGRLWEVSNILPEDCVAGPNVVRTDCSEIDVYMKEASACLEEYGIVSYEEKEITTNLETVLDTLKENLQNISPDLPVNLEFSSNLLSAGKHKTNFKLNRKNKVARSVCEHIAAIENRFNWSHDEKQVKGYLSCNTIYFSLSDEPQLEGFESCL